MRASITTLTFDPTGHIELDVMPQSALQDRRRRTNRIATLDGGAVFNEAGYADSDRTYTLRWQPRSRAVEQDIDMLVRQYSRVRLSIDGGLYLCAIQHYAPGVDESELSLLVVERQSQ